MNIKALKLKCTSECTKAFSTDGKTIRKRSLDVTWKINLHWHLLQPVCRFNAQEEFKFRMKTFFAVQQSKTFNSGFQQCLSWARQQLREDQTAIQVLSARGGDKDAVVIAELTIESERMIYDGRTIPVKRLLHGKN